MDKLCFFLFLFLNGVREEVIFQTFLKNRVPRQKFQFEFKIFLAFFDSPPISDNVLKIFSFFYYDASLGFSRQLFPNQMIILHSNLGSYAYSPVQNIGSWL